MAKTIRSNNTSAIMALLEAAVLIRLVTTSDMGGDAGRASVDDVVADRHRISRVRVGDDGTTTVTIYPGVKWYVLYASVDAARATLTPEAFARYFPNL